MRLRLLVLLKLRRIYAPRQGDLDVWSTLKFIRDAGYDGYVSVEFEGMEDGKIGSETGMEAARYILANA